MTGLLVALGGGVGAALRFVVAASLDERFPRGTLLVNVLGSGLIGALAGLGLGEDAWALLAVGFCGGFTTYSAFAVQAVDRGPRAGGRYAAMTLVLTVAACVGGFALAS